MHFTIAAAVALVACVSEPEIGAPIPIPVDAPPEAVRPMPEAPHPVPASAFAPGPGGYAFADAVQGTGEVPVGPDRTIVFDFVAWQDGGPVVGTSYARQGPSRIHLTTDASGWIVALTGATAGGVRQVRLPAEGRSGAKTLVEATVHEVLVPPVVVEVGLEQERALLPSGIEVADLTTGAGIAAEIGHRATFEYAVFAADGTELDSSWRRASPVRVHLGRDRLAFEPVLIGMTVGTRRQAWVPPSVAFPQGPPEGIHPSDALVLVVELSSLTTDVNIGDASHTDGPDAGGH